MDKELIAKAKQAKTPEELYEMARRGRPGNDRGKREGIL